MASITSSPLSPYTCSFRQMRLTIIAPDSVYEHEVDPSMEVQDVQALIEAEVSKCANGLEASFRPSRDDGRFLQSFW